MVAGPRFGSLIETKSLALLLSHVITIIMIIIMITLTLLLLLLLPSSFASRRPPPPPSPPSSSYSSSCSYLRIIFIPIIAEIFIISSMLVIVALPLLIT